MRSRPDADAPARRWRPWALAALVLLVALGQCFTLLRYTGQNVDESEVVGYAVGFLGGDLNPHWFGYGSFPLYVLGLLYFVAWGIGHLFGAFGSLLDFAGHLLTDEHYFYASARYVFACVGVATALAYAKVLRRAGLPLLLAIAYFALVVTHPKAIAYANITKTDQFVGLFFAVAAFCLANPRVSRMALPAVSLASALALTSKVSAAPILALLAYAAWRDFRAHGSWRRLFGSAALFLVVVLLAQPYSNPIAVAIKQLRSHASDRIVSVVRPVYDNPLVRARAVGGYLYAYLAQWHPAVVLLVPFAFAPPTRRAAILLFAVGLLIASPFMVASDIQPYWMIPLYPVAAAFPVMGAYGLSTLFPVRWRAGPWLLRALLLLALVATVAGAASVARRWAMPVAPENRTLMQRWLEENVLGRDIVVLERSHSDVMPEVHDLSSLPVSRAASRLFIFNRRENEFLGTVFDRFLVHRYLPQMARTGANLAPAVVRPLAVRLDLAIETPFRITVPRLCNDAGHCVAMARDALRGASEGADGMLVPTAKRQRITYHSRGPVVLDATRWLDLSIDGEWTHPQFVAMGVPGGYRARERLVIPASGHLRVPLFRFGAWPWLVNYRVPKDLARVGHPPGRRLLFVTSPAIYNRYLPLDPERFHGKYREQVETRQDFYARLLAAPLVKRIDEGRGPAMEVYDATVLPTASAVAPPRSDSHLWLQPAAVDACIGSTTVMVHWDASGIPGVRSVEVKTVRPRGAEGLFARGRVVGSKRTGPWMKAGRELLLRDHADGRILGRATLGALPCGAARPSAS